MTAFESAFLAAYSSLEVEHGVTATHRVGGLGDGTEITILRRNTTVAVGDYGERIESRLESTSRASADVNVGDTLEFEDKLWAVEQVSEPDGSDAIVRKHLLREIVA